MDEANSFKVTDLPDLHCALGRVGCYPQSQYFQGEEPTPENFDSIVVAMLTVGVQPYLSLNYDPSMDPSDTGIPDREYATWFGIGAAFAARFEANSSVLTGQGITDIGIYGMAAMNEPASWSGSFGISTSEYHDILEGLADGVHSVNANMPVYPGGMSGPDASGDYTENGYVAAVADLVNDGTLAGIDVHVYHRGSVAEIITDYDNSQQFAVDAVIDACEITRADANYICTEVGMRTEPEATTDGYDEEDARNWFLTALFDVWATTRPNGSWSDGPRFPWNLWRQGNDTWFMAAQTSPRVERWHGITFSMLMNIVHDMAFVSTDPRDTGVHKLAGGGKTAWVFQNIAAGWSSIFGSTFTISDIPDGASQVEVYDGNGLIETVESGDFDGANEHQFSTTTGKSYLFVADAEDA